MGVSVIVHHSMHMIVTSFSFTLTDIHTNTPSTQSVHVILKLTMDKSDTPKKKLWGKPHCLLRNHLCQRQRQKTCPIKYGRWTQSIHFHIFTYLHTHILLIYFTDAFLNRMLHSRLAAKLKLSGFILEVMAYIIIILLKHRTKNGIFTFDSIQCESIFI